MLETAERLHDFLDFWTERQPDVEFAVDRRQHMSYREAQAATRLIAAAFIDAGLQRGDRIAILGKNCVEYALIYLAASRVGVVPVPLNYRSAPPEWQYVIQDAGARLLLAADIYQSAIDPLRPALTDVCDFVMMGGGAGVIGWRPFDDWMATSTDRYRRADGLDAEREGSPDDALWQLYTSGTTGQPKGAVLSQSAVVANLKQLAQCAHRGEPGARSLVVGPMLHAGVVWSTLAPLSWGASLYIVEDVDPFEVVRLLSEERIDYASLVPTVLHTILERVPDVGQRSYPTLRLINSGSSSISERTLLRARTAFGCPVVHGYGLTESTAALSVMAPEEYGPGPDGALTRLRSAGRALPGTELRIVDEHDQPLPPGEIGEIVARGPQIMQGYWHRPEATAETLRGGWLHTGDVGRLDDDGFLYIQDRLKDVIVTGGLKVYPLMVEQVLVSHPGVAEAAVVGVPDERWGESVRAVVVQRSGTSVSDSELMAYCRERLGGFQCPRTIAFVDTLPRTATGKVLKRSLREAFWAGQARQVGEV